MVGTLTTLPEDELGPDGVVRWLESLPAATDEAARRRLGDACRWVAEGFGGHSRLVGQKENSAFSHIQQSRPVTATRIAVYFRLRDRLSTSCHGTQGSLVWNHTLSSSLSLA